MGQNFLVDQNILGIIVEAADIKGTENIIEIGPGIGSLTQFLLRELDNGRLYVIEKDKRFIKILKKLFSDSENLDIINNDVLEINWIHFREKYDIEGKIKIIANLPYYITTPIIMDLLEADYTWDSMIFMVQKEVAERMIASPGGKDYGSLSIAVQFHSKAEIVREVPPTVFMPSPEVYSSIIKLEPYEVSPYKVKDKELFFRVVKAIFQLRRKNIKNALTMSPAVSFTKKEVFQALENCNIDSRSRGEKLSLEKMVELGNSFYNLENNNK